MRISLVGTCEGLESLRALLLLKGHGRLRPEVWARRSDPRGPRALPAHRGLLRSPAGPVSWRAGVVGGSRSSGPAGCGCRVWSLSQ